LPVLGAIPKIDLLEMDGHLPEKTNSELKGQSDEQLKLVTHLKPKSPVSEAYRSLRTNLQFSGTVGQKLRCFLVTSSVPGEGKSTTAANLAIAICLQGTRTILIDSDLRRPVLHRLFDVEKNKGLSNVLIGKASLSEAIQSTRIKNWIF